MYLLLPRDENQLQMSYFLQIFHFSINIKAIFHSAKNSDQTNFSYRTLLHLERRLYSASKSLFLKSLINQGLDLSTKKILVFCFFCNKIFQEREEPNLFTMICFGTSCRVSLLKKVFTTSVFL